ncbi:MAG: rhamnan synthesis F family protein [Opitutales bacterium]
MKPILVHIHIYYVEMWQELKACLRNIEPNPYDLYVTIVESNADLEKDILAFKPNAKIEIVENRGFDIAPFVHIINQVNLDDYDYVVKLHTKRDIINQVNLDDYDYVVKLHTKRDMTVDAFLNGYNLKGDSWRKYLLNFISTKEKFENTLSVLFDKKVAMVSDYRLLLKNRGYDKVAEEKLESFLKEKGFPYINFYFVAGTMFIAKANVFKPMQNMFSMDDFEVEFKSVGQMAHLIERFFGYLVYYNNQEIYYTFSQKCKRIARCLMYFFYQNKITTSGKRLIKIGSVFFFVKN